MKLGTFAPPGKPGWRAAAFLPGDKILDLAAAAETMRAKGRHLDAASIESLTRGAAGGTWLDRSGIALARAIVAAERDWPESALVEQSTIKIGPPVPAPRTFIAAGRNYMDHLREGQKIWAARGKTVEQASFPTAFIKLGSSITAQGDPILLPVGVDNVDYEIELCVVIGHRAHRVSEAEALNYVAGYTVCNDVGARRIQRAEMEHQIGIVMAKNFKSFAPLGPWMVTADEIPDPQTLDVRLTVNGDERQHANTSDMIFSVAKLVSYWSALGLEPGDMITTGTPAGVALARPDPAPFYLKDGDLVEATIERIGTLANPVRQARE
ncbi:MAG: fumarylacetoacetate hydrolase family protein [Alphaproteobacteria bacterium]|nr:fumarylacetoacetate hydrolase family protein [Alphaproteobacteria bacterium]